MPQAHIRLARTPDVDRVLSVLRNRHQLLSEAEIIKLALSEQYNRELYKDDERIKQAWERLKREGKKLGKKLMREKGLDPKKVTEQEFYDLILDDHKHA